MNIGSILMERMKAFNIDANTLAEKCFIDNDTIQGILNNVINLSQIDEYDLQLISDVLYCQPEYFTDSIYRNKDIIKASLNRGENDLKSNLMKGKLQRFANDFAFIKELISEDDR